MKAQWAVDEREVQRVLRELVAIPSVNPAFPGGCGESGVARYVMRYLERLDIPYMVQEIEPGRSNVIGMLAGAEPGPALLFEAHMDTVQTAGMTIDPFAATVEDGKLYGRGACDTKGSLAAMLVAVGMLRRSGLPLPVGVHLAAVVDEEYHYAGISAIAEAIRTGELHYEAAVVGEPTGLHRVIAHKGCVRFHIHVHGVPGHSSNPAGGTNAIVQATEIVRFLQWVIEPEYAKRNHPLVGPPTHCITEITGGDAPNTIPGSCRITVDRRTVPGEEPMDVYRTLGDRLRKFAQQSPDELDITIGKPIVIDYSMEVPAGSPILRRLERAVSKVASGKVEHGAPYGTDASKLHRVGVPSVVFGPGDIRQAHASDEWVDLAEVAAAAEALADMVLHYREE